MEPKIKQPKKSKIKHTILAILQLFRPLVRSIMSYKSEPRFDAFDIKLYMFLGNRTIGVTSDIFRINLRSV
jgi:hypothetical protein